MNRPMPRFLLLTLLFWVGPLFSAPPVSLQFTTLLDEGGLVFVPPAGYQDVDPAANPVFSYERAIRSADGRLEIRYAVRPLKRLKIDYDDPHGAVPDPNHIFPLMFESLSGSLAAGGHAPSRHYQTDQAKSLFQADWAAAAVFDVTPDFATTHRQGLLLALHRNKLSDAYVVFLFDDYAPVKAAIDAAMSSLVYRQPPEVAAK